MTPATVLDPRYSDPTAVAVTWDETQRILRSAELFWMLTLPPALFAGPLKSMFVWPV